MVEFAINFVISMILLFIFLYNNWKYGSSKNFDNIVAGILAIGSIYLLVSPFLIADHIEKSESDFYLKYFLILLTFIFNYSILIFMFIKDELEK
jgi:FlaA1/EpsC-like NDP-sugar epimerase